MTQPNALPQPSQETARNDHVPPTASDFLLNLVLTLLAPMFLLGSNGDIHYARIAALGTINDYRARDNADLISVVQIVAFGLAALGSLSLSMADDLSLNMILRLRGNANACNRSAEQNRQALQRSDLHASQPEAPPPPTPPAQQPKPQPQAVHPPAKTQDWQHQAMWVAAMATVAEEYAAELPNLPPEERKLAEIRVNALNYCVDELRSGVEPPPPNPAMAGPPRR